MMCRYFHHADRKLGIVGAFKRSIRVILGAGLKRIKVWVLMIRVRVILRFFRVRMQRRIAINLRNIENLVILLIFNWESNAY